MFFALLGWTGMVTDATKVWGANPTIWFVLGLIIAVALTASEQALVESLRLPTVVIGPFG